MSVNRASKSLEEKLSFDQFSRQKVVSYLIESSFRKSDPLKIIDIGGYMGKTADFHPEDTVTVMDVFDGIDDHNYIKGDATSMPFTDGSFDIACSFDVLEHITREKRQDFINEAVRVSKIGVFIAVPVDNTGEVVDAEVLMNDFYKVLTSKDHKWLKEHIDYRIPSDLEIKKLIINNGAFYTSLSSNQVGDWQLMQELLFMSSVIPEIIGEVSAINTWYNNHSLQLEANTDIGYRKIFFISKHKNNVEIVTRSINRIHYEDGDLMKVNKDTFVEFSATLSKIGKKYKQLSEDYRVNVHKDKKELVKEINDLKKRLDEKKHTNHLLKKEIDDIKTSKSWILVEKLRSIKRLFSRS